MFDDGLTFLLGILCFFSKRSLLDLELHPRLVSNELWFDVERLMDPVGQILTHYHLRLLYGPWSGCGPVTSQLLIVKGKQCQAKSSSRGIHWGMVIWSQCNISRMKLSQSVLGLSSQRCYSGNSSISPGPGWLVETFGWEVEWEKSSQGTDNLTR